MTAQVGMDEADDKGRPHLTDKARREAEAKRERLAQALRENLKRRKAQGRARAGGAAADPDDGRG